MTEAEWLTCADPQPMLESLRGKATDRKLRLFAVAVFRATLSLPFFASIDRTLTTLDVAERYADGLIDETEMARVYQAEVGWHGGETVSPIAWEAAADATDFAFWRNEAELEVVAQCHFFRDVFGNPFRPVTLDPAWQTTNVLALAQAIYDDRAFDRMPILADALEDAGCDNADILNHCRQPGEHVRGCWVVDLVLGKE